MPLIYDMEAGAFVDTPAPLINSGGGIFGQYRTYLSRGCLDRCMAYQTMAV